MTSAAQVISLRPANVQDQAFLLALYASTREEELNQVAWPPGAREAFLAQQFDAQSRWWREQTPDASFDVVLVDGERAGRLYVDRRTREIRIVDISLTAAHRGRGIGTSLLKELIDESDAAGLPLSIHVEQFNPARHLYERLGFSLVEDRGVYLFLERQPQPKTA